MNIKDLLNYGIEYLKNANIDDANLKAKLLLANSLKVEKEYLITHDLDIVIEEAENTFKQNLNELREGKPLQYIIGKQEFMGLEFLVNENVLIPQPDTEILVEETIDKMKQNISKNILDICTGSGCIAVSIARNLTDIKVYASDISNKALEVARINAMKNNVNIEFILSDMFENINTKFDVIVSNPPYIEKAVISTLPIEVQKEPIIALDGGEDGLVFYRKLANEGKKYLDTDGFIAVEIGYNQKEAVMKIFEEEGYKDIYSKKDFSGNDRIVVAKI